MKTYPEAFIRKQLQLAETSYFAVLAEYNKAESDTYKKIMKKN
jgi:hypothetical protein